MDGGGLRARVITSRYFEVLVLAAVLAVLLGGYLTVGAYGQQETETTTTTEIVGTWTAEGHFSYWATVENGTRAFPEGEKLENRSSYFRSVSPELNGTFVFSHTASRDGSVDANGSLRLLVRSVDRSDEAGKTVYWRFDEVIEESTTRLSSGESLRFHFSRDMREIERQIDRVEAEVGGSPGAAEAVFVATVDLDGTRNGQPVNETRTYRLPVTFDGSQYRVNDTGPATDEGRLTAERPTTSVVTAGPLWRIGGPLFLVLGIVGVVSLAVGQRRAWFDVSERERDYLAYRADRSEFDEWITRARLSDDVLAGREPHIETTTLSGLVDLAIDTDRRVIEATDRELYVVVDDDVVYSYQPPTRIESSEPDRSFERSPTADGESGSPESATATGNGQGGAETADDQEPPGDEQSTDDSEARVASADDWSVDPAASGESLVERLQKQSFLGRDDGSGEAESDSDFANSNESTPTQDPDTTADGLDTDSETGKNSDEPDSGPS